MRRLALVSSILLILLGVAGPAAAREITTRSWIDANGVHWTETVETWIDNGLEDAVIDQGMADWSGDGAMAVEQAASTVDAVAGFEEIGGDRLVAASYDTARRKAPALARFGPFAVLDARRAALVRETDTDAPYQFKRMLAAYPSIGVLELYDCPGTVDDNANLVLGRMIHNRGIATDVPPGGSVRSGAVDLFLAGVRRTAAGDAEFAVHAWLDEYGLRPSSFSPNSPVNRKYVLFYHAMGMPLPTAKAFYDLTNSVPNERALWLSTSDLAHYAALDVRPSQP